MVDNSLAAHGGTASDTSSRPAGGRAEIGTSAYLISLIVVYSIYLLTHRIRGVDNAIRRAMTSLEGDLHETRSANLSNGF